MAPVEGPTALQPAALLREMFDAAVRAADPMHVLADHLPEPPKGRTIVVGAGKASAQMAAAVEKHWPGPVEGVVVTRYGHAVPCRHIEILEAAHPVPDEAGVAASRRILEAAEGAGPDDLVLCLISGGGSALLTLPAPGLTLADKQAVNGALLASGAAIGEMNTLRKHISAIKGGRLAAAAAPAKVVSLLISDVPGDSPAVIASGPTVPDPSTRADALAILDRRGVEVPDAVRAHLESADSESPKPGDPAFDGNEIAMIATPQKSLEAAADVARAHGVTPMILGDAIEGEARHVASVIAGIAGQVRRYGQPLPAPCVLISGGETTVTLAKGQQGGSGGRNSEFALGLAVALDGAKGIFALAADTDGIDGSGPHAGAIVTPDTLARAADAGVDPYAALTRHNSLAVFQALGETVETGPTLTNVNDFRAVLVLSMAS